MEKINTEEIRARYKELLCSNSGTLMSYKAYAEGDDTEKSLKILAKKINEIIDVLSNCAPKILAKWVPEEEDEYFFVKDEGWIGGSNFLKDSFIDQYRLKSNNFFRTKEEAEEARDKIMNSNEGVV